jgi:hypothetical protein
MPTALEVGPHNCNAIMLALLLHAEDKSLHWSYWNRKLANTPDTRLIEHDNTKVDTFQPSDANLQRLMYSSYYAVPLKKGGVAIQPCGWITTLPLFVGAVGDSRYIKDTHILKQQHEFAANDKTSNEPFTNVLDRS